jgi:DNA-binding NarL/FixJ family response regulator
LISVGVVSPILAIRAGLRSLLESSGPVEVVWETHNLSGLEELPEGIDVLLLASPVDELQELKRLLAGPPGLLAVLVLTGNPPPERSLANLPVRAWGILGEDSRAEELMAAIQALHLGLLVGDPALARLLLAEGEAGGTLIDPLTERELEVLQWLAQGLANKQIATQLGISEHTVKFHVSAIYSKLGATNRAEAVRLGVQQGLILL